MNRYNKFSSIAFNSMNTPKDVNFGDEYYAGKWYTEKLMNLRIDNGNRFNWSIIFCGILRKRHINSFGKRCWNNRIYIVHITFTLNFPLSTNPWKRELSHCFGLMKSRTLILISGWSVKLCSCQANEIAEWLIKKLYVSR